MFLFLWVLCRRIDDLICQKQVSRLWINNYIPKIVRDLITYACLRYLLLARKSSIFMLQRDLAVSLSQETARSTSRQTIPREIFKSNNIGANHVHRMNPRHNCLTVKTSYGLPECKTITFWNNYEGWGEPLGTRPNTDDHKTRGPWECMVKHDVFIIWGYIPIQSILRMGLIQYRKSLWKSLWTQIRQKLIHM